jgi:chromosome segregation ATPase
METTIFKTCLVAAVVFWGLQSLADIAREETGRRKLLSQSGMEAKVIEADSSSIHLRGSLTVSTPSSMKSDKKPAQAASSKNRPVIRSFQTALKKLDNAIRKDEKKIQKLRERLREARWALPKVGRVSGRGLNEEDRARLQAEIEELELKLKQLRRERAETFDDGRKAGYLPGELEGKGIIP